MIMELYINCTARQENDNTIGKLLCLPEWFSGLEYKVDAYATAGWCGSNYEPEEYPELNVNDAVIVKVYNELGKGIKITKKQADILDHLVSRDLIEDACWDYLECQQEDVGDY